MSLDAHIKPYNTNYLLWLLLPQWRYISFLIENNANVTQHNIHFRPAISY